MAFGRAFPIRAHTAGRLALPPQPPITIRHGVVVTTQARQRTLIARGAPEYHVTVAPPTPPPKPAVVVSQAVKERGDRAFAGRFLPYRAHVPLAVIARGPPVAPAVLVSASNTVPLGGVGQSLARAQVGRGPFPKPHLAGPVLQVPAPPATILSRIAVERAPLLRSGHVHVAPPVVSETPAGPPPLVVSPVRVRAPWTDRRLRDVPPSPHLAPPVLKPQGPGATVKVQSVGRALLGRGGHLHLPAAPGRGPVPSGTFVYQSDRRPYLGRWKPQPHLASPVVTPAGVVPFLAPAPYLVSQARQRPYVGRWKPQPHLPTLGPGQPFPPAVIVSQALRRPSLGRWKPEPHLPSLLTARQPLKPATVVSQAERRPYLGRTVPRPHLAAPIVTTTVTFVAPAPYVVSQALRRPLIGRTTPRPHLPPGPHPPFAPGKLVLQAVARVSERKFRDVVRAPRVAPPVLKPAGPGATVRQESISRALLGRGGHVRHAGPVLQKGRIASLVVKQAIQRMFVGRSVPLRPRLAPPNVAPPLPPAPPTPLNLLPGLVSPHQVTGTTSAKQETIEGRVSPSQMTGNVDPQQQTGRVSPQQTKGD